MVYFPIPIASSTEQKKVVSHGKMERKRLPINYAAMIDETDSTRESQVKDVKDDIFNTMQKGRLLAQTVIDRVNQRAGIQCPHVDSSKNVTNVNNQSTVNESDLLRVSKTESEIGFFPVNKSTPRSSEVKDNESYYIDRCTNQMPLHQSIAHMSQKIRNSNISLKDLCSEYNRASINTSSQELSQAIDSKMFVPAELLIEKLQNDEESWRREKGIIESKDVNFSNINMIDNKDSFGDFFKGRSEKVTDGFFGTSPEKKTPVPLIDITNIPEMPVSAPDDSIMSISEIAKVLGNVDSGTPTKVVNLLLKKGNTINLTTHNQEINKNRIMESDSYMVPERDCSTKTKQSLRKSLNFKCDTYENDVTGLLLSSNLKELADKENNEKDRSITSTRSVSSLDELPEGKLPIKSTRTEVVWGCLRMGRNNIQQFCIRNKLNKKIRFQASVTGLSFRILKDHADSEMLMSMKFSLHPFETKTVTVMFCPTGLGAFSEKLHFSPIINGEILKSKGQIVLLTGYGGHSSIDISNISKDTSGKLWLSMGNLLHQSVVTQSFNVKNTGTLPAFICLEIGSRNLYSTSNLLLEPKILVLKPSQKETINVTYCPSKQDFRNKSGMAVLEIAYVKLIYGAEAIRGRIRRLYSKLKLRTESIDPLIEKLSQTFPNENIPSDLNLIKESVGCIKDLLQELSYKEITLTLEQDSEHTLVGQIDDIDETSMYQTLHQDNITVIEDNAKCRLNKFKVEPTNILLTPPIKNEDALLLQSECRKAIAFEISAEPKDIFNVSPKEGIMEYGDNIIVKVTCNKAAVTGTDVGKIKVYVENEIIEVSVKSVLLQQRRT